MPQEDNADQTVQSVSGEDPAAPQTFGEDKRSFTQSELDALFSERAKRSSTAAVSDLLKKFGVKDMEQLDALVKMASEAEAAKKTELERAQAATADLQARAEKAEMSVAQLQEKVTEISKRSHVIDEARSVGFRPEALEDVWLLVDKDKIKISDDGTVTGAKEAVEALSKQRPYWLAEKVEAKPKGTPTKPKLDSQQTKTQAGPNIRL